MREVPFVTGEIYHIWNRGVDKRNIVDSKDDVERFFKGLEQFNTPKIIGELSRGHRMSTDPKLVEIVAYCLNPNHFHLMLEQVAEKGIERFMHKLCMGYSKYFNTKHKRSGSLFGGKFKAKNVDSDEYLLHLSAYINLNHLAHSRGHRVSTLGRTSWGEYVGESTTKICKKDIILKRFKDLNQYKKFAEDSLKSIIDRKLLLEELEEAGINLIRA